MMGFERSDDYQPLFWVQGRPVHVTTLLVILHSLSLVVCCLVSGMTGTNPWEAMSLSSEGVLHHWKLWQIVTYVFVQTPSLWFVVNMFFLFMWGREVERFFGRNTFIALYAGLVAVTPVVLLTHGLLSGANQAAVFPGANTVHFGVFLIFATIYPGVQFFFGIPCKWIAYALGHDGGIAMLCLPTGKRWAHSGRDRGGGVLRCALREHGQRGLRGAGHFPRDAAA